MKAADFLNHIAHYAGRNLFLIIGTEAYIADTCAEEIIRSFKIQNEAWNLRIFREKASSEEVLAACLQAPCFSLARVTYLDNIDVSEEALRFSDILAALPDETKLVIKLYKKPDMRKNIYKTLFETAVVVEAEAPEGDALIKWVLSLARKEGVALSAALAEHVLAISGEDMYTVKNEIAKLSHLSVKKPTEKDLGILLSATIAYDAFSFHKDMLMGRWESAFLTFDKLHAKRDEITMFIGLLVSKFAPMHLARLCMDAGLSTQAAINELTKNAGLKNYPARLAVKECARFSKAQIEEALRLLEKMDRAVKTGEAFIGYRAAFLKMYGVA